MLHLPLTHLLLLAAKQEPYRKAHLLTKNTEKNYGKKVSRMGQQAEKNKSKRNRTLHKNKRGDSKEILTAALRFQKWGRHQTFPASLGGLHNKDP